MEKEDFLAQNISLAFTCFFSLHYLKIACLSTFLQTPCIITGQFVFLLLIVPMFYSLSQDLLSPPPFPFLPCMPYVAKFFHGAPSITVILRTSKHPFLIMEYPVPLNSRTVCLSISMSIVISMFTQHSQLLLHAGPLPGSYKRVRHCHICHNISLL